MVEKLSSVQSSPEESKMILSDTTKGKSFKNSNDSMPSRFSNFSEQVLDASNK